MVEDANPIAATGGDSGSLRGLPVGRVLGTEDATPLTFSVAVAPESFLQLDDVVTTTRTLPAGGPDVRISGVVTEVTARHEGASFDSDVFLIEEGILPAMTVEAAEVTTTRVDPEVYVPPLPGTPVHKVTGAERDHALYFDQMTAKLPIGLGRDGDPLFVNLEFLDGTRGAHVNISGISGVATKTTFATFLLYSLFNSNVLGGEALNTKALIFNVKGEDLLFLDHANAALTDEQRLRYSALGLPADSFRSVAVYAPPRRGDATGAPDVSSRTLGVRSFFWTLAGFCEQELLPFVFADAEDERQQYTMVVHNLAAKLRRDGRPAGDDGAWQVDGTTVSTYSELVDLLVDRLNSDPHDWAGTAIGLGTVNAFIRRLVSSVKPLGPLIRADVRSGTGHTIATSDAQVTVVDLHNLSDRAKRFVVGVTVRQEFERKESAGRARPLLLLVLDELNKYAPREGHSPIKEILLDVAERGRSLGVVLIGAQQTASEVERRIIANSSIRVVGRLDAAEAGRPEYGFLPPAQRQRALLAKPGTMFVSQPEIPVPLVVEFPFPSWATRPAEAGEPPPGLAAFVPDDPFAAFPRPDGAVPESEVPPF
ncbi:MAG TPA: ATP-binding protein [Frankiaceae bacterium]|nr:ATP-binding protein [Frankiaceae bacterium]